jgi:hypothetical protein
MLSLVTVMLSFSGNQELYCNFTTKAQLLQLSADNIAPASLKKTDNMLKYQKT